MTFDRDEQFLHEKLSADLHPAPVDLWPAVAENLPAKPHRRHLWLCLAAPLLIAAGVAARGAQFTDLRTNQMAKLVKHLCLQAYDEVTGSRDFITSYFPKMVFLVGSPAYNNNGEVVLGTAEGGTKITLYAVNNMDPTDVDLLNEWYFKTIHHEFAHILNQKKPFSTDFNQITGLATGIRYVGNACWDVYPSEDLALKDGFISRYASTSAEEEFVEVSSIYVTNTAATWEEMLETAGEVGRPMLEAKFEIVDKYMKNDWGIDLDELRKVVLRRQKELPNLDLDATN